MIIDPAAENQVYCTNGTIAKWFINDTMIGFNSEQLSNGTSFNKEALPSGKKIIWDTSEHIINNPDNYSYSIIGQWEIRFKGSSSPTIYTRFSIGKSTDIWGSVVLPVGKCLYTWRHLTRNDIPESPLYPNTYNALCGTPGSFVISYQNFIASNLIIIDDNITYNYLILNINSIEIIDITGNKSKFTFNASNSINFNTESFELIADSNSKVSLVCGLDCPPNTCLKVRCNNIVCCYNNQGKVIDSFYDFNKEVETCY